MKYAAPLVIDGESGEVYTAVYQAWCLPERYHLATTPSQQMFLNANIELFEAGEITEEQAKLNESALVLNAWVWADMPKRNAPTMQQKLMRSLLLKTDDDEYEEEDDEE